MGQPWKHSTYVRKQQKISQGGSDKDEPQLETNYQTYINSILETKIAISTNVLF